MYTDYKELGKRIAKRRKELKMKQQEVNEQAGLSDKYLSNIERGVSVPSIDVLMRLCAVLKITPDSLLIGTENMENMGNVGKIAAMKVNNMSRGQQMLALSMLDWIEQQKL